ncbi:MAG: signal peptide peptidase SppA [Vicinamibacterales bacterium]
MARRGIAVILAFLGAAIAVSIAAFIVIYLLVGRAPVLPDNSILLLRLNGDLPEIAPTDVVGYLSGDRTMTLRAVVDALRKAKSDPRVAGVLLEPKGFSTPYWAKLQEIRDAITDFRGSGKPVYAYLEIGSDRDYYIASAADRVFLMPSSVLDLTGVASYELFLRGTLDMAGVYPDLHHVGDYKTAVNQFVEHEFTPEHRQVSEELTRGLYDEIVGGVAESRSRDESEIRALMDTGPFLAQRALDAGLVDGLAYADEVDARLRAVTDAGERATIDTDDYDRVSLRSLGLNQGPRIAVIHASGAIVSGESQFDPINGSAVGSDTLIDYIRRVRRDSSIRAMVLRIDSPGGSAIASDAIWRELMIGKDDEDARPIVASMSDLAASGGYYIAMAADAIVAQPSTLTGSIGIFGGKFVTGGLYNKLGANIQSTSAGRFAEMHSPIRPYNEEELVSVREQLQSFYDGFVEKVAESRGRTPEEIHQVAQGRVWTGRQALDHGLVDALGGLDRAVIEAKALADIPVDSDVELVVYPARRSLYELLTEEFTSPVADAVASRWLASRLSAGELEVLRALRGPLAIFREGEPLALMPGALFR